MAQKRILIVDDETRPLGVDAKVFGIWLSER